MEPGAAARLAVSNTTPIIGLVETGALTVLARLFDRVVIPGAVWTELNDKPGAPEPAALLVRRAAARSPLVWLIAGPPVVAWRGWRAAGRELPRAVRVCYGSSLGFLAARAPNACRQGGAGRGPFWVLS